MTTEIELIEISNGLTIYIPEERASATLTRMDYEIYKHWKLEPGEWFFFNRLINQSGKPGLGSKMLNKILAYCQEHKYSILNTVNAYGSIKQKDLEHWYISKGFSPLNPKMFKNSVLIWRPQEIIGVPK